MSGFFVAFAHEANDVVNAIGPLSGFLSAIKNGVVGMKAKVSLLCIVNRDILYNQIFIFLNVVSTSEIPEGNF